MSVIIDFFSSIIGTISALIRIIYNTIISAIQLVSLLPSLLTQILTYCSMLPIDVYAYIAIALTAMFVWAFRRAI